MYPGDHSNPSPMTDGWLLLVAVRPSTAWEEYSSRMSGAGPPTDGGTRMWYAHEKSPDEPPADHVEDGARLVAAKLPVLPDGPEVSASSVVPDSVVTSACSARLVAPVWAAGRSTSALIVWPRALLVDGSGTPWQPGWSGAVSAHPGSTTRRSRLDQSAPYAVRKP